MFSPTPVCYNKSAAAADSNTDDPDEEYHPTAEDGTRLIR